MPENKTHPGRPRLRRLSTATAVGVLLMSACAVAFTQTAGEVIDVQPGDTFSAIAARFVGSPGQWRKMYRPELSNLPNPNVIRAGAQLEVAKDDAGTYLRLLSAGTATAAARSTRTAAAPATTTATAAAATPANPSATVAAAPAASPAPATTTAATTPAAAVAPAAATAATTRADDTLVIGVLPNVGAALLNGQYENLKRYLERGGARKVSIVVPANFKAFFDSTMRGDYDLAVAAPHFARVAQVEKRMMPMVGYEPRINALLVAPQESTVASARDLRERTVAFANPTSLVAMYGQQWLRQAGLEPGRDYEVKGARTDLGVGRMLLTGDAAAAVLSNGEFRALPPEESARMKVIEVIARVPNFIVLANPRIERERAAQLRSDLKAFLADKTDGDAFAKATGFSAIVDVDEATMRELDPFTGATKRAMGWTP
jgi:phosphonate transport system substrate-binding protein